MEQSDRSNASQHRRWMIALGSFVAIDVLAIACLLLVQQQRLDRFPWAYIAIVVAFLAALAGLLITMGKAKVESDSALHEDWSRRGRRVRHRKEAEGHHADTETDGSE